MEMELVRVPQINANEEEVDVVEIAVEEGEEVQRGDRLCTFESTKATMELEAPADGYVRRLSLQVGDRASVGELVCALTEQPDQVVELEDEPRQKQQEDEIRTTRRARELIDEHGLDVAGLDTEGIVTERDVLAQLGRNGRNLRAETDRPQPATPDVEVRAGEGIVIYGAGGHARVVIDIIREARRDLEIVGIVDDADDPPSQVLGIPVVGDANEFSRLRERGVELAALGIGAVTHNALRGELYQRLEREGFTVPNLIHPEATVEPSVQMGYGNQIFAGAVVSSNAQLGNNGIINSNVVVSHDCRLGDHVHLTPGALLAGGVRVGDRTVVGMGVTVYLGVEIGSDVMVANGNHLLEDVEDDVVVRA